MLRTPHSVCPWIWLRPSKTVFVTVDKRWVRISHCPQESVTQPLPTQNAVPRTSSINITQVLVGNAGSWNSQNQKLHFNRSPESHVPCSSWRALAASDTWDIKSHSLPFSAALPLIFSCLTLVHRNPLSKYLWKLTQPESNTLFSLKRIHTKNLGSTHSSQLLQILWKLKAFKPRFLTKRTVPCKVLKWSDCYLTCPCLLCIYCQSLTTRGRLTLRFLVWLVL